MEGIVNGIALRRRKRLTATGGTYDYLESDQVPRGEIWIISSHSFENETGARGTLRGYVKGHGYYHWLWEQASPVAATLYWSEENFKLTEGERLGVRQVTCTASDQLQLLLNGYIIVERDRGGGS